MSFDAGKLIHVLRDILWQEESWLVLVSTMDYLSIFFCHGLMITNKHPRLFIFPDPSLYNENPFGSVIYLIVILHNMFRPSVWGNLFDQNQFLPKKIKPLSLSVQKLGTPQ